MSGHVTCVEMFDVIFGGAPDLQKVSANMRRWPNVGLMLDQRRRR